MAVNLQAVPGTGLVITPDNSGNMTFSTGLGVGNVAMTINSNSNVTMSGITVNTLNTAQRGISVNSMPAGTILQVVQSSYTAGSFSTTSGSYSNIGLGASITPTLSTSKILVIATVTELDCNGASNTGGGLALWFNGSPLTTFDTAIAYSTASGESDSYVAGSGINYIHSPNTTNTVNYSIAGARTNGSGNFRIGPAGGGYSSIVLWEIAQ